MNGDEETDGGVQSNDAPAAQPDPAAIAGKTDREPYIDENGNRTVQHPALTRGQQWGRIAGDALRGAAAGLAAGKGAGNGGKALQAGLQAQEQHQQQVSKQQNDQADQDYERQRQNQMDKANSQILQMQLAESSLRMSRLRTDAHEEAQKFSEQQHDYYKSQGAHLIATLPDASNITDLQKLHPDLWRDHFQGNLVRANPVFDENGNAAGTEFWLTTPGSGNDLMPEGTKLPHFVPSDDPNKPGHIEYYTPADPMTRDTNDAIVAKAQNDLNAESERLAKLRDTSSQAALRAAQTGEALTGSTKNRAEAGKANAEAAKAEAETANLKKQGEIQNDPNLENLARGLITGDIPPHDLASRVGGTKVNKNDIIARAIQIAKDSGTPFSLATIEQEDAFARNPKTQAALDGIDRMVGTAHEEGMLDRSIDIAAKAGLTGNAPVNGAQLWIRQKLGEKAAIAFQSQITETRRSIAGLIGNPLLGGGETDKKLDQADKVLGNNPTLENLKYSAQVLKDALGTQRSNMVSNNRYLRQRYGQAGANTTPSAPQPAQAGAQTAQTPAPPPGADKEVHAYPGGPLIGHVVNNVYVPLPAQPRNLSVNGAQQ